jgi:hypothetical protein
MKSGVELIQEERQRQIEVEGWTAEHDAQHVDGELAKAAACYTLRAQKNNAHGESPWGWPWDDEWWKPSPDPVRNLAKAGALIAAEIDRLNRMAGAGGPLK